MQTIASSFPLQWNGCRLCDGSMDAWGGDRWAPCVWRARIDIPGLGQRLGSGETECGVLLPKRRSRGARVAAIDNGPLKGGALDHPLIEHRREDAFRFKPAAGHRYDWLFCDMVEDPRRVMELVAQWTRGRWCRHFVVNLKFGHADALALLDQLKHSSESPLRDCAPAYVRHLFHDREEFTLVGSLAD